MLAVRARLQGWALVLFFVPGKMKLTAERYRTASGSDRIIFHLSFAIGHWPFGGFISNCTMSNNQQMKNAKWEMIRSLPLAVR